jgi:tetratricopeptide (TPR) repeat protein
VSNLLIGLVSALVATNQPLAVSNLAVNTTGVSIAVPDLNDPVEKEYHRLLADDDAAQAEADKWIRDNQAFAAKGAGVPLEELNRRIMARFDLVRKAYEDFLQRHPDHARARVAYGSFLSDISDEDGAQAQWEQALALDPKNPAIYNNLAELYAHSGPTRKAFDYYTKAIELNPREPLYYDNFGTVVYLFRKDAMEYYGINEAQVFAKAFELYSNAMRLDPDNFPLASRVAQTYYAIKPLRTNDALVAWTNALNIARDEIEREGVYIHLARVKMLVGRFDEARQQLNAVTNEMYADLKRVVTRSLAERESKAQETNAPPAATETPIAPPSDTGKK